MLQTVTWEMSKRHVWGVMSRGLILKSVIIIMKHIAAVSVLVRGWEDERPKAQELDSEQRRHKRLCRRKTTGINAGKVPSWLIWKLWWDSFFCYQQPRWGATIRIDGAARGETKLAWAIPSRDRGRQSQTPPENEGTEWLSGKVGYKWLSIIKPWRGDTRP